MNKNLKVAFFGTSDRSVRILETLKQNFDLKLCVTKTDTKVGRKQETRETQVKKWARENQIPYLTIESMKSDKENVIEALKQNGVEIAIVADFSFMIPQSVIETPKYKMINIHFSLLPKYRGASPVQFAILNGDEKTGVTYYVMDKGMDTGHIIWQVEHCLAGNETSGELYDSLFIKASENMPDVIEKYISGEYSPTPQNESLATYCRSKTDPKVTFILKDDAKIDWTEKINKIEAAIRAYKPWPIAWTTLAELEKASKQQLETPFTLNNSVNKALTVKIFKSVIESNRLAIKELQIEGKNKIDWNAFLNGYTK